MKDETKIVYLEPQFWLDIISRRRWLILIPLLISGIVGLYFALTLPKQYSATTLIAIQSQRVPRDYVQSLVTEDTTSRIATLRQEILSRTNLEKIIHQFNLFSEAGQQDMFMEDKVRQLRQRIGVHVGRSGPRARANSFSITYAGSSPERVSAIANALASLFIDENLKIREAQALGTSDFLQEELSAMKDRLEQTETALRNYRFQHMGELPDQLDSNLRILDRLQRELNVKEEVLRDAKMRLVTLSEQPQDTIIQTSRVGYRRLSSDQLQAELTRLRSRYTDKHPDIILLKQLIEEARTGELNDEPQAVIDTRNEISELEEDIMSIRNQIATYNQRVENAPQREADLISLKRNYDNLRESYNDLLDRKLEAEIAVNMERKQKGEQFRIIDPARTPVRPTLPDIQRLLGMALVSGLGIGAGLCFLLEYLNPVFRRPDEIETFLEIPLIATIPAIYSRKKKVVRWLNNTMAITASGVACLTYAMFGILLLSGEDALKPILKYILNITI